MNAIFVAKTWISALTGIQQHPVVDIFPAEFPRRKNALRKFLNRFRIGCFDNDHAELCALVLIEFPQRYRNARTLVRRQHARYIGQKTLRHRNRLQIALRVDWQRGKCRDDERMRNRRRLDNIHFISSLLVHHRPSRRTCL